MTISDICIKRPVFTWVLVAIPVVLGLVSYDRLGRGPVPQRRLPGLHGHDRAPGASVEEMETSVTKPIEDIINTVSRHRRAAVDDDGGGLDVTVQFLLSKNGDVGTQEVRDKVNTILARPARRDRVADHRQVRHRLDAGDDDRRLRPARLPRGDRAGAQADQGAARDGHRRRRGHPGRRPRAGDERRGRHRQPGRLQPLDRGGPHRPSMRQNLEVPGGRIDQGPRELVLRTLGRLSTARRVQRPDRRQPQRLPDPDQRHRPGRGLVRGAAHHSPGSTATTPSAWSSRSSRA